MLRRCGANSLSRNTRSSCIACTRLGEVLRSTCSGSKKRQKWHWQDSSARTARVLQEVQWQLSEAKEQLAESRSASLAIQSERSKLRLGLPGPSDAELQLQLRLELQQRLSQQLRAELEAERAGNRMHASGGGPGHAKREEAPTLDLAALGPGAALRGSGSAPAGDFASGGASAQVHSEECRPSRMHVEQNVVTVPLLPPPKVVSVAGDDGSSSILSPRSTDATATVTTRAANTKQVFEAFPDQRKSRVLYLDASLDVPGEQQQNERLGLMHERPHGQGGVSSLSHLPVREEVIGREPLACRIVPAPGTSPWLPQAQTVLPARHQKKLAILDLSGGYTPACLSPTTSHGICPQELHRLSGSVFIHGTATIHDCNTTTTCCFRAAGLQCPYSLHDSHGSRPRVAVLRQRRGPQVGAGTAGPGRPTADRNGFD